LDHLHHHSLALLLIELLQVKVISTPARDRFDSGEFDDDKKEPEDKSPAKIDPIESNMLDVITIKRQEVVSILIKRLSSMNTDDIDNCLNAHAVLLEIADNEQMYGKLAQNENVTELIIAGCDIRNPN
jgi:hypothetical protein